MADIKFIARLFAYNDAETLKKVWDGLTWHERLQFDYEVLFDACKAGEVKHLPSNTTIFLIEHAGDAFVLAMSKRFCMRSNGQEMKNYCRHAPALIPAMCKHFHHTARSDSEKSCECEHFLRGQTLSDTDAKIVAQETSQQNQNVSKNASSENKNATLSSDNNDASKTLVKTESVETDKETSSQNQKQVEKQVEKKENAVEKNGKVVENNEKEIDKTKSIGAETVVEMTKKITCNVKQLLRDRDYTRALESTNHLHQFVAICQYFSAKTSAELLSEKENVAEIAERAIEEISALFETKDYAGALEKTHLLNRLTAICKHFE